MARQDYGYGCGFDFVPEEVWTILVKEFDMAEGQIPIAKKVIEEGGILELCNIDVSHSDLMTLQLTDSVKTARLRA